MLFAAGGTGGHVYPALAIADAIREIEPEAAIVFAGTRDRLEWEAVPEAGYEIQPINAVGWQRPFGMRNLTLPYKVLRGIGDGFGLVRAFDPDVVVGTGGYVSGPVLFAAHLNGRPTAIQEQNAYAGWTNRIAGRFARMVFLAFPEAAVSFDPARTTLTGNPIRRGLLEVSRADARRALGLMEATPVVAAVGGSGGSVPINNAMATAAHAIVETTGATVLWQAGSRYFERTEAEGGESVRVVPYVDRMDLWYAAADLFICRSGAVTCSELLATGTPAVLVPSPHVAEDHQTVNARSLVEAGASVLLPESQMSDRLVEVVVRLLEDPPLLREMSNSGREASKPNAAIEIARSVLSLAWEESGVDRAMMAANSNPESRGRAVYA